MSTLSEAEFVDIVEREERVLMGDTGPLITLIFTDIPRMLEAIRELQRRLREAERQA